MIKYTPEQLAECVDIYKNLDSSIAGVQCMLKVLKLHSSEITGEEWCEFMDKLHAAVHSPDTSIRTQEPHHDCCCADIAHDDDCTCACSCHEKASTPPPNVKRMYELATSMADTYARKNADYGDSFHTSVTKYGLIAALTRMSDKWNRLENLMLHGSRYVDEALTDTLIDLAAYALMTVMEVE